MHTLLHTASQVWPYLPTEGFEGTTSQQSIDLLEKGAGDVRWLRGSDTKPVRVKFKSFSEFYRLCSFNTLSYLLCDMLLSHLFPVTLRRYVACFLSLVLLFSLQRHGRHQQRYKALQGGQAALPAVVSTLGANETGPASLRDSSLLSPPTIDQLIASDPDHYPPWNGYEDKDYDPNHWHFLPL